MTLACDVTGEGPAVVLIHSTACDRRMWDPQLPALVAAGRRVVRLDLRGFGRTPMPDRPYNEAQDVADLMDRLGVGRAALVASSGGGQVAQEVAARWPARVTALVLLCTALRGHEPGPELRAFGEREDELLDAGDLDGATELNVATWLGPVADAATREKLRLMQRHAFEVQLAAADDEPDAIEVDYDLTAITAPTLLVSGSHDLPDFRLIAAELAGRLAGAAHVEHVELPWAGHLPSMERPEALNPVLVDFLRRTPV
ncbi:MAG TPA: alpha/beta hydrolase [Micromonosporaceae bacterium]|nr:alpha/beta hydrolase [Micromonosporaceae bacterium]